MLNNNPRLKRFLRKIKNGLMNLSAKYRLRNKVIKKVTQILPNVSCIDIGASYYPHPAWEVFRRSSRTNWIAVEPNRQNLFYLKDWTWPAKVQAVETGLSETGGKQTLFVTNVDSGSSLLEPVLAENMVHRFPWKEYLFPLNKVTIDTITLQNVVDQLTGTVDPIAVKLDTQGSEFSILKGVDINLIKSRFFCIELENTLQAEPIMTGSTPFYEVFALFEKAGFELVHLKPIQITGPFTNKTLGGSTVLNECDAIFLLRISEAKKRGLQTQLALVGAYVSYSLFGEALNMLNHIVETCDSVELKQHCNEIADLIKP